MDTNQSYPPPLPAFIEAINAFNAGEYYRCHEIIEDDLWRPCRQGTIERLFYQGILQVAVGCFHQQNHNITGTKNLWRAGLEKLRQVQAHQPSAGCHHWVALEPLVKEVGDCLLRVQQSSQAESVSPIKIKITRR